MYEQTFIDFFMTNFCITVYPLKIQLLDLLRPFLCRNYNKKYLNLVFGLYIHTRRSCVLDEQLYLILHKDYQGN